MTLDHSALWSMYASLEELRGKIGHVLKCAIQMSKVAWSNVIAKRCRGAGCLYSPRIREESFSEVQAPSPASSFTTDGWTIGPHGLSYGQWLRQLTLENLQRRYARSSARSGKVRGALCRAL